MITTHTPYLWIDASLLTYFLLLNGFYAFILLLGFPVIFRRLKEIGSPDVDQLMTQDDLPPISIIIPAFNEHKIIHEAIASIFNLDYPHYTLIVVNDGSEDETMEVLKERYGLMRIPPAIPARIKTEPVRAVYRSKAHPNFIVVDKERGNQEDAVNAGLNVCSDPYYLATDADALVEPDTLRKLARVFLTRHHTIGVGGALRVGNGCRVENGLIKEIRLPSTYLTKMQLLEYLRGFFFGRLGWNALGGPFVLCGAFGLHEKRAVLDTGGYRYNVPAADIDLTIRLHGKMHELKSKYNMEYVPDAVIWTEVPRGYKDLSLQRKRWYCSVIDVFWKYKYMTFYPKYARVGFLYIPYLLLGEAVGPLIEAFAYLYIIFTALMGVLNYHFLWMWILIAWGFSTLLTFLSLGMEQVVFRKYVRVRDVLQLVGLTLLENFGYRQLSVWWRVVGFFRFFTKHRHYREHSERHVFSEGKK
ncbi:MAG: glycosyltransferase family 2 protein [Chlamydiales bacterium]|nr:glycosyltransferase family 2 protein [Chlamydiales bacterium]